MFPHESDYELKNIQEICGFRKKQRARNQFLFFFCKHIDLYPCKFFRPSLIYEFIVFKFDL